MTVLIHDLGLNKFYLVVPTTLMLKGLETGDLDGLLSVKRVLEGFKPMVLKEVVRVPINKIYQIDTKGIMLTIEEPVGHEPVDWRDL